jgi:hypothetical protein
MSEHAVTTGPENSKERRQPDIRDLERLVEFELRRLEERRRRFGWTPWALLIALSGFAWKALDEAKLGVSWKETLLLCACLHIGCLMLEGIRDWLGKQDSDVSGGGRFFNIGWFLAGTRENI